VNDADTAKTRTARSGTHTFGTNSIERIADPSDSLLHDNHSRLRSQIHISIISRSLSLCSHSFPILCDIFI